LQGLEDHGQKTDLAYSARIVALEQENTALAGLNSLHIAEIAALTEANEKLLKEKAELQRKQQTIPSRKGKTETSTIRRVPFWRVAGPLVNRLIAEAKSDTQYTRPKIQDAFLLDLENFPELKPVIQKLLATDKKEENGTPYDLEGWGMEAIRAALGDYAQTDPHAPKKTKKH